MDRTEFKKRMQSLKSYREQNPDKGYWDWKVEQFQDGGDNIPMWLQEPYQGPVYQPKELSTPQIRDTGIAYQDNARVGQATQTPQQIYNIEKHDDLSFGPLGLLPVVGDVEEVANIALDLSEGNYGSAAAGLGLLAIPGSAAGKIYRKTKKLRNLDLNNLSEEELDKLYLKAIHDKDNELVQQLRDFHFQKATNQVPEVLYHGAPYGGFTSFDSRAFNATIGGSTAKGEKGNFFTPDLPAALRYSGDSFGRPVEAKRTFIDRIFGRQPAQLHGVERIPEDSRHGRLADTGGLNPVLNKTALGDDHKSTVYPVYIKKDKVFDIDFKGKGWSQSPVNFPSKYRLEILDNNRNISSVDNFLDFKEASEAYQNLSQEYQYGHIDISDLEKKGYDLNRERSIERWTGAPKYNSARLVEQRVPPTTNGAVTYANDRGYKTVIISNVRDANTGKVEDNYPITDVISLEPKNIKLADPITYDDNGNIIPLSKRDNFNVSDIRYSLFPLIGGATIYGLSNNDEQQIDNFEKGGEIPPDNSPVHVNPFTKKPLANGVITPVLDLEGASNFTPAGDVLSIRDAYVAAKNNDLLGLGLAGLGFLPFVPRIGRSKVSKVDRPPIPEVHPNYFQEQMEKAEKAAAKRKQTVNDFYTQQDKTYESLIENEDAFRRAVNADVSAGTNYTGVYGDYLKNYSRSSSRYNDNLTSIRLTDDIPSEAKAQVDPRNLNWIRVNSRYADPDELDPVFQQMNPGLVRHELGHVTDEKAGLDYVNKLGDRSKFESESKLKEMFPKTYKRVQDYLLRGSEIKSHMNEFRDYLYSIGQYSSTETAKSLRQKLDKYGSNFKNLKILFDAYKNKRQFARDYNTIPLIGTSALGINYYLNQEEQRRD